MREDWDTYFMRIALQAATRATCDRKHIGCVVVDPVSHTILSTGYNGSIRGSPHCDDVGHMMEDNHCVRTVHAESNAIAAAAYHGIALRGATLYCTASPCWLCFRLLANAGIKRVVFGVFYRDERIFEAAKIAGIALSHLEGNPSL